MASLTPPRLTADARAALLALLGDGRAYTRHELAKAIKTSPDVTTGHLQTLAQDGALIVRRQGPHHYFQVPAGARAHRRGGPPANVARIRTGPRDPAMRAARLCYGHLAGPRGVQLYDWLVDREFVAEQGDGVNVTPSGWLFLCGFGIDRTAFDDGARPPCKTCLDWTERRSHLGGPLAKALLDRIIAMGWADRDRQSRLLTFSALGAVSFDACFAI